MFSTSFATAARAARRAIPSLVLAAAVLASTFGASGPAFADGPIVHDHRNGGPPAAHVQIVLKGVHIFDDRDWIGEGEMHFVAVLICQATPAPCDGYNGDFAGGYQRDFSANDGETIPFDNQIMPAPGDNGPQNDPPTEAGYPLYPGHTYQLKFFIEEQDTGGDFDNMGERWIMMTPENDWGLHGGDNNDGSYNLRSVLNDRFGDFSVEFDVKKVALPDLRPVNLQISDLPGSTRKHVCTAVQNIEAANAGPFAVILRVDDVALFDGRATMPGLASGNSTQACADAQLPTTGQHKIEAIVMPTGSMIEYDGTNNILEQTFTAKGPAAASTPAPTPAPATTTDSSQPDLAISAIKVNGQTPDGKNDCKDGKSDVAVTIKNAGTAKTNAVAVRLSVDGAEVGSQSVKGLEAGQEREIRFEDVRLKKGQHKLAATGAPKDTVAESQADNNTLTVTVACTSAN